MVTKVRTMRPIGACSSSVALAASRPASAIAADGDLGSENLTSSSLQAYEPSIYKGAIVCFPDKSQWKIQEPISNVGLQRADSPCEGTQVFTAVCVKAASTKVTAGKEATIKIRFQVKATEEVIDEYEDYIDDLARDLKLHPQYAKETQDAIAETKTSLRKCTQATKRPSDETLNEVEALYRLLDGKCQNSPWLLNFEKGVLAPGTHRKEVEGGYIVFILMTKVPGATLSAEYLWDLTPAERENLREDFGKALHDVYRCGIVPHDTGLCNLIWDKENRKCYIVDFENTRETTPKTLASMETPEYMKKQYKYWGLSEGYYTESGIVRD